MPDRHPAARDDAGPTGEAGAAVTTGQRLRRTEDARLITGRGRYVESLPGEGALRAVFVRSPLAHARVSGIDTTEAAAMPGVAAVWSADDLDLPDLRAPADLTELARPALARDVVRFAGEAVAVVIAESREAGEDAAERVLVDYDPLPPLTDPETALDGDAPLLFPAHGSNLASEHVRADPDALADADVVVRGRFAQQRLAPLPMEGNAILCAPDGDGLAVWVSTQVPFRVRDRIAGALGLAPEAVRVVAPDVGGGFGAKGASYPEHLVIAAAARRLGRPVRWAETRSENMTAMCHARGHIQRVEVGATRDGVITGLRIRLLADCGAYPTGAGLGMSGGTAYLMACGAYRIPKVDFRSERVVTTTTPIAAYRGAGRPEAAALIERAVDLLAAELGLDPVEVRRRNLVPPDAFPHTTATGAVYDSGDYQRALDEALAAAGYDDLRADQARRRAEGDPRLLGIGVSTYVEVTGRVASEHGAVSIDPDGTITVETGSSPQGQGHETTFAQMVAAQLAVPLEAVRVTHSDTAVVPQGVGTFGSRTVQIAGSAIHQAGEAVLAKARRLVAHLREAAEGDVTVLGDGRVGVRGSPETGISWGELAAIAEQPDLLPEGMEPGLRAAEVFDQAAGGTYPFGAHVAVVEVDAETGLVRLLRHVAADDAGRIINPLLADGQVHGGLAQGIAQALYEELPYDADGNPQATSLMDYLMPGAPDLPAFELRRPETPTHLNPLGAKGIGEAATIGSTPAVQNAVVDALSHLGVRHLDLPLTPERVWRALGQAAVGGA